MLPPSAQAFSKELEAIKGTKLARERICHTLFKPADRSGADPREHNAGRPYLPQQRCRLLNDRTRRRHRMTARLKAYFPQVLPWFDDIRTRLICD
jgi:hypothetical protein